MSKIWPSDEEFYQSGASWATQVQQGLSEGKTFHEMLALTPEEALRWRESEKASESLHARDVVAWLAGYLSRWD